MSRPAATITPRDPKLAWKTGRLRYWFGGSPLKSNWMNALSTTFPPGERFFIDSVRHYQEQIRDPVLAEQVRGFIAQEAAHGKEHRRFNALLEGEGYPAAEMEEKVRGILNWVRKNPDPEVKLALTCALEHFTTIICTEVLRSPVFHEPMEGEYRRLWCWHCLEEIEHKAVAYDVYQAVGGSYRKRVVEMIHASLALWPLLVSIMFRYQRHDRRLYSPRDWWTLLTWGFIWPGLITRLVPHYVAYFKKSYHPSQIHEQELIDKWRERLTFR